jgi:hypothetical protein
MKSISIRGVDDELATVLKKNALAEKKSVNQYLLDSLKKLTGLDNTKRFTAQYNDLDDLFGNWTKHEFDAVQTKIDEERRIDEELWRQ